MIAKLVILVFAVTAGFSAATDLTSSHWKIVGLDQANGSWSNSDLYFTSQVSSDDGFELEGYFGWYSDGVFRGRELFTGTLSSDGSLELRGHALIDPIGIITANYTAQVTSDFGRIVNGIWEDGIPGTWAAVVVPQLQIQAEDNTSVEVSWATFTDVWYRLEYNSTLVPALWLPLDSTWRKGDGATQSSSIIIDAVGPRSFFRLSVSVVEPE